MPRSTAPLAISADVLCLPSSVLARSELVDSACGLLGPGCRSKHWMGVGGSRMAHGLGGLRGLLSLGATSTLHV